MSEHKTKLTWKRKDSGFGYKEFPRGHEWAFPRSGQTLRASAAPEYLGDADRADPEEAFTAALTSCHMLTFLAIASMSGFVVDSYEDEAIGHLEESRRREALARQSRNASKDRIFRRQDSFPRRHREAAREITSRVLSRTLGEDGDYLELV
jgi:organic hydroperoxide reductase OsmC/OhrA